MKSFGKSMLLFILSNEKHQFLSSTEILLWSKVYGNMQTLPMIDLVYNTLTTVVQSPTPSPFSYSSSSSNNNSSNIINELPLSSPSLNQTSSWFNHSPNTNNNNNNLYNLDKHQVLLGSGSGSLNFTNTINNYNITGGGGAGNDGNYLNGTYLYDDDGSESDVHKEFIFDRTDVRVIFITLYSLVFCCCFFGKYLLIFI